MAIEVLWRGRGDFRVSDLISKVSRITNKVCRSRVTSVNDIPVVEIIYSFKNLPNGLRSVPLCESTLIADSVEQLASYSQLCHNIVLVLQKSAFRVNQSCRPETLLSTRTNLQIRQCVDDAAFEA